MSTGSQGTLFYVDKTLSGHIVWETTPQAAYDRLKQDPTLSARLDRAPFATRGEAERCREVLRAAEENEQGPEQ